jgi:hypothetical protein
LTVARDFTAARDRFQWRRRPPKRAAARLGWSACLALFIGAPAWLIFGSEPAAADDGAVNPLALVIPVLGVFFAAVLAPQVLALVRRPVVGGDHYALTVRPGVGRTLVLPWAQVAEVTATEIDEDLYLLVRCLPQSRRSGDWPRWSDQAHLRSAKRDTPWVSAYDLAVPMNDFDGTARSLLGEVYAWAPSHVLVVDRTTDEAASD